MAKNPRRESSKYTILVVDDEELMRNLVASFLSKLGHSCLTAIDGVDALEKMKENEIDVVITDIKMPNMDGITLTSDVSMQYPGVPIMVMTAFEEEYSADFALSPAFLQVYFHQPF